MSKLTFRDDRRHVPTRVTPLKLKFVYFLNSQFEQGSQKSTNIVISSAARSLSAGRPNFKRTLMDSGWGGET